MEVLEDCTDVSVEGAKMATTAMEASVGAVAIGSMNDQ